VEGPPPRQRAACASPRTPAVHTAAAAATTTSTATATTTSTTTTTIAPGAAAE
jgi:hypothetical protein